MSIPTPRPTPNLRILVLPFMLGLGACGSDGGINGGGDTAPAGGDVDGQNGDSSTLPTYTVTATAGANGSISPASATVSEGDAASFTVTPDVGYDIDSVSGCDGTLSGTTYTTGAIAADCTVSATFELVAMGVRDTSVMEGDSGSTTLTFTIELSGSANGAATVDYVLGDGTATVDDNDYSITAASGTLTIDSTATSTTLDVTVLGDALVEPNEHVVLALSNPSANVILDNATSYGIIADDDSWRGPINDTGATACYDGGSTAGSCPNASYPGQDAEYGRDADASTNSAADGRAGFSFTKLDSSGAALADQTADYATTPWNCVQDNTTGLMWEVKTSSGLHRASNTYYWYDSNPATNGGTASSPGTSGNPDTEKLVADVNTEALCGYSDWRLPTADELRSIVDHNDNTPPIIDTAYFPNASDGWHLTATTLAGNGSQFWAISFISGASGNMGKAGLCCVARLVRGGQ